MSMKLKVPHLEKRDQKRTFKAFIFVFLMLYHLEGIVSLIIGTFLVLRFQVPACDFLEKFYIAISIILASGSLIIIVCTIGIVVNMRDKEGWKFRHYILIFSIVVVLEVSSAIRATIDKSNLTGKTFYEKVSDDFSEFSEFGAKDMECWENIQTKYQCCGVNGYEDWIKNLGNISMDVAKQGLKFCICDTEEQDSDECTDVSSLNISAEITSVHQQSCYNSLYSKLSDNSTVLRIFGPCLAISQCVFLIFIVIVVGKMKSTNAIREMYTVRATYTPQSESNGEFSRF